MTTTIGMLNIMPKAQEYVPYLLDTFCAKGMHTSAMWIRLATHTYTSTPARHMALYRTWEELQPETLDGLILTGAPVEHLPFASVSYWPELTTILDSTARHGIPILGLCWGGLVVGHRLGITPDVYKHKCFGVFKAESHNVDLSGNENGRFCCPHSRFAGFSLQSLERAIACGTARLLADGPACGPFIIESTDRMLLGHLGHMEYPPERLIQEYNRDLSAGRKDVSPPVDINLEAPLMNWMDHRHAFVARWLETVQMARLARRGRAEAKQ